MSNWPAVPLLEAVSDKTSGNPKTSQAEYLSAGRYPIVDQGKDLIAGFTNDAGKLHTEAGPVVVFGDHTRCFKYVDFPFCMGADGVKVLKPRVGWHPKFLYYYLASLPIPSAGYSRHFKFLKEWVVVQPPIEEQRRIVKVLDRADELCAKRREALAHLDDLARSIFLDMFGDPVTNARCWPSRRMGEVGLVTTGNTPPRAIGDHYGDYIEWIKSDNIVPQLTYLTQASERLSQAGRRVARTAAPGSVLVTCIAGSPASIGNAAIADREVAFNQQINAIKPHTMDSLFLFGQLLVGKKLVQEQSTGGMKGLVNKSRFESIRLIDPPARLQHDFARRFAEVERLKLAERTALAKLHALFASLRNRAFRGLL
jgi:type I restriction enzyme, S subunit